MLYHSRPLLSRPPPSPSLSRPPAFDPRSGPAWQTFSAPLGAFWAVFSLYAQLGCTIFGGKLRADTWPDADDVKYVYCNFNDFGSALVTLFYLVTTLRLEPATTSIS